MILNGIANFVLTILGWFITPINFTVDFLLGFEYVKTFIQVVAYVLPWNNLLPLFTLIIVIFIFRAIISLIKTLWELIPTL